MRFSGAALGPDAVLVWTGERELTRFERDGTRSSFTLAVRPLGATLTRDGLLVVDERGTIHRYTVAGQHLGFVPLLEAPGSLRQAAVSADGALLGVLAEEVDLFEHGRPVTWPFAHRRHDGWRELGLDVSGDGHSVLVFFETLTATGENLGDNVQGFSVTRRDGAVLYRHVTPVLPPTVVEMSFDARWLAICEHGNQLHVGRALSMETVHRIEPAGQIACFRFRDALLGVLFDYELVLVDLDARREARLALPEQFEDVVLTETDAVAIHPELGAWWIPLASVTFAAAAG